MRGGVEFYMAMGTPGIKATATLNSSIIQFFNKNRSTCNMKAFIVLAALACVASAGLIPATTIVRAPAYDSAVIKSDRLGGNFAYSTVENHAYAAVSPIVQHVATPVGVSYSAPALYHHSPLAFAAPALVSHAPIATLAHSPLVFAGPALAPALAPAVEAVPAAVPVEDAAPAASVPVPTESAAPTPAESAPVAEIPSSDDTVAIESA